MYAGAVASAEPGQDRSAVGLPAPRTNRRDERPLVGMAGELGRGHRVSIIAGPRGSVLTTAGVSTQGVWSVKAHWQIVRTGVLKLGNR